MEALERRGFSLESALLEIVSNAARYPSCSSAALKLLNRARPHSATSLLLDQFQSSEDDETISFLTPALFMYSDPSITKVLSAVLVDSNETRRREAAYLLAHSLDRRAVLPLERALEDCNQNYHVREFAAEGLGYHRRNRSVPLLIRCLADESPSIRFWCVFALGSYKDPQFGKIYERTILNALEAETGDNEAAPGYWSVGLEALAMLGLGSVDPLHRAAYAERRSDLLSRDEVSESEKRWLECYRPWEASAGV